MLHSQASDSTAIDSKTKMNSPDPRHWTVYWTNPFITSFRNLFPDNYDGSIRAFWEEQLTGNLSHIIDVGCGNGALTWLCNDILNCEEKNTAITGIDFADIDPFAVLNRNPADFPAVSFLGNCPAERLPFDDRSIDMAISQYGIEYTDFDKSIPEISRVLTAEGRICLILHDVESDVIRGAMKHLPEYKRVLEETGLHDAVSELDDLYSRAHELEIKIPDARLEALNDRIRTETKSIRDIAEALPDKSPVHMYLERFRQIQEFSKINKPGNRKPLIEYAQNSLRSLIGRIDDLQMAALTREERGHLESLIVSAGFEILQSGMLSYASNRNIGSMLVARR